MAKWQVSCLFGRVSDWWACSRVPARGTLKQNYYAWAQYICSIYIYTRERINTNMICVSCQSNTRTNEQTTEEARGMEGRGKGYRGGNDVSWWATCSPTQGGDSF